MRATLLVELLTEELPPKTLRMLSEAFKDRLFNELVRTQLKQRVFEGVRVFATPRRLAVSIPEVEAVGQDRETEMDGPAIGAPAQAIAGFAKKHGVAPESLGRKKTPKGEVVIARVKIKGLLLDQILSALVADSLKALPIPKVMRWGDGDAQFVRPVHGLVMLHGRHGVPGSVFGLKAGNVTRGHRFMGASEIALRNAEEYEERLLKDGAVIADFTKRRDEIERQLLAAAEREGGSLGEHAELLDEVTALVELPSVYVGRFDPAYLEVPQECLILTMRQNQKYFPLFDPAEKLLPKFLIVSNMKLADPRNIVGGNERVVRPRLEDARFFYNQDRKVRLETRVPLLAKVVFHHKLGSQLERVERIQVLAGHISRALGAETLLAERAARLSKADLLTGMVGEFPELQGIMGYYYAKHDGEHPLVCEALKDQYKLRFNTSDNPENLISASLFLADKIELLVGLFGIGQAPTGEKDPFGLRRAALGIISVFELLQASAELAGRAAPDILDFLQAVASLFPSGVLADTTVNDVREFIFERYWHSLAVVFPKDSVEAVISLRPRLGEVTARVNAVQTFRRLPQAESLAAANKRIRNILRKSESIEGVLDESLLKETAERSLFDSMRKLESDISDRMKRGDFTGTLNAVAVLREPVDAFFDKVLVNVDDARLRANRHALLKRLDALMNQVADISRLAT